MYTRICSFVKVVGFGWQRSWRELQKHCLLQHCWIGHLGRLDSIYSCGFLMLLASFLLLIDMDLSSRLPTVERLLASDELSHLATNKKFQYLLKTTYEHIRRLPTNWVVPTFRPISMETHPSSLVLGPGDSYIVSPYLCVQTMVWMSLNKCALDTFAYSGWSHVLCANSWWLWTMQPLKFSICCFWI